MFRAMYYTFFALQAILRAAGYHLFTLPLKYLSRASLDTQIAAYAFFMVYHRTKRFSFLPLLEHVQCFNR